MLIFTRFWWPNFKSHRWIWKELFLTDIEIKHSKFKGREIKNSMLLFFRVSTHQKFWCFLKSSLMLDQLTSGEKDISICIFGLIDHCQWWPWIFDLPQLWSWIQWSNHFTIGAIIVIHKEDGEDEEEAGEEEEEEEGKQNSMLYWSIQEMRHEHFLSYLIFLAVHWKYSCS